MQINYKDNIYILEASSSPFSNDDCPTDYVLGVFESQASAISHANHLFGFFDTSMLFNGDDELTIADDPLPGVFSITITRFKFCVLDSDTANRILLNAIRTMRNEQEETEK